MIRIHYLLLFVFGLSVLELPNTTHSEERLVSKSKAAVRKLPDVVSFNAHIRPLMSNTCFACHGPDEEDNASGYRIDSFEAATSSVPSDDQIIGIKPHAP